MHTTKLTLFRPEGLPEVGVSISITIQGRLWIWKGGGAETRAKRRKLKTEATPSINLPHLLINDVKLVLLYVKYCYT